MLGGKEKEENSNGPKDIKEKHKIREISNAVILQNKCTIDFKILQFIIVIEQTAFELRNSIFSLLNYYHWSRKIEFLN